MSGAASHFPEFSYDTVRIHTLMIYSDIVEYSIAADTKAALLDVFRSFLKLKMEN